MSEKKLNCYLCGIEITDENGSRRPPSERQKSKGIEHGARHVVCKECASLVALVRNFSKLDRKGLEAKYKKYERMSNLAIMMIRLEDNNIEMSVRRTADYFYQGFSEFNPNKNER